MLIQFVSAKIRADYQNPQFTEFEAKLKPKDKTTRVQQKIVTNIGSDDISNYSDDDSDISYDSMTQK